jgi:hypothetical protein
MSSHAAQEPSPVPGVSAAGTPGDAPGTPAHRGQKSAAHGVEEGLAPPPGLLMPPLGAARRAVGTAGARPNPGFHR